MLPGFVVWRLLLAGAHPGSTRNIFACSLIFQNPGWHRTKENDQHRTYFTRSTNEQFVRTGRQSPDECLHANHSVELDKNGLPQHTVTCSQPQPSPFQRDPDHPRYMRALLRQTYH